MSASGMDRLAILVKFEEKKKQIQFYITGFITKPLLKVVNILLKNE